MNVGRHVFISADAETPACQQRTVAPLLSRERKRMLTASSNKKEDAYSLAPNPSFEDSQWIANKLVVEPKPLSDRSPCYSFFLRVPLKLIYLPDFPSLDKHQWARSRVSC